MLTNEQLTTNLKVARARLDLSQKETVKRLGVCWCKKRLVLESYFNSKNQPTKQRENGKMARAKNTAYNSLRV